MLSARHASILGVFIASALSHMVPIFSKGLYEGGWTPIALYFAVLVVMCMVLATHELISLERGTRWKMNKKDVYGTVITAITGGVFDPLLFFTGLRFVSASESMLLTSMVPMFVVFFSWLLLKEHLTKQTFFGSAVILSGVGLVLWNIAGEPSVLWGAFLILAAGCFGGLTTILHKRNVKHRHLDSVIFVKTLISTACVGFWIFFMEPESLHILIEPQNVWLVLAVPLAGFLVPYFLYFNALNNIQAMEAGILTAMAKILGILMAVSLRGEVIPPAYSASLLLIVVGTLLINAPLTRWRIVPSRLPELGPLRK